MKLNSWIKISNIHKKTKLMNLTFIKYIVPTGLFYNL